MELPEFHPYLLSSNAVSPRMGPSLKSFSLIAKSAFKSSFSVQKVTYNSWLVISNPQKNMSQLGLTYSQYMETPKMVQTCPNHQPALILLIIWCSIDFLMFLMVLPYVPIFHEHHLEKYESIGIIIPTDRIFYSQYYLG